MRGDTLDSSIHSLITDGQLVHPGVWHTLPPFFVICAQPNYLNGVEPLG